METVNSYFDKVLCISLSRRKDRWEHALHEFKTYGIEAQRIEGVEMRDWGNDGCTWAHRKVLDIIRTSTWNRVLVLEDDFRVVHSDFQQRFGQMIKEVPDDWELLYLGGHYADAPKSKVSEHVIHINRMKTTSSYGITKAMAARMAPSIHGSGPIDELFSGFSEVSKAYIFKPRLMVQYPSFSDLQRNHLNYEPCMMDTTHENMV